MSTAALIVLGHGLVDAYAAFLHPLLPRVIDKFGLSIALATVVSTSLWVAVSVVQPAIGYLADRYGRRLFVTAGPLVAGVFFSSIGLAPSLEVLILFVVLGGLGAASFHPPAAVMVARAEEGRGSGLRFSVFSFGGASGFALGPLIAVALVGGLGFGGLWIAMVPGILLAGALWYSSATPRPAVSPPRAPLPDLSRVVARLRGPLGLLFGISAVAAFVQRVFVTMMPLIVNEAGGSEATGAVALSVYLAAQAFGTLSGGWLADRVDRRVVLAVATALAAPLHLIAVLAPPAGWVALLAALGAGFLNMALLPPIVVMAQEMLPDEVAISSGIVMGLAWVPGSFAVLAAGLLGDQIGPAGAAAWMMPVLLLGTWLALQPSLRAFARPVVR